MEETTLGIGIKNAFRGLFLLGRAYCLDHGFFFSRSLTLSAAKRRLSSSSAA